MAQVITHRYRPGFDERHERRDDGRVVDERRHPLKTHTVKHKQTHTIKHTQTDTQNQRFTV